MTATRGARTFVVGIQQPALGEVQCQDLKDVGIHALDGKIVGANVALHADRLVLLGRDAIDQRRGGRDAVEVVDGELDLRAGFLSAGLLRGAAGKDADDARAPVGEDDFDGAAKSGAVGQQEDHGGDAPGHAQHGERGAAAVVAHRCVGLR